MLRKLFPVKNVKIAWQNVSLNDKTHEDVINSYEIYCRLEGSLGAQGEEKGAIFAEKQDEGSMKRKPLGRRIAAPCCGGFQTQSRDWICLYIAFHSPSRLWR